MKLTNIVTVEHLEQTGTRCDYCGAEQHHNRIPVHDRYTHLTYDSYPGYDDSAIDRDVCGINCYISFLKDALERCKHNKFQSDIGGLKYELAQALYDQLKKDAIT